MGREFAVGKVRVFWDLKDFPVPEGRRIREIVGFILKRKGYTGAVSITAYGETAEDNLGESGITFVHRSDKYWRLNKILVDIGCYVMRIREPFKVPTTLMVVAKNIEQETEFVHLLQNLSANNFNVFLVVPDVLHPEQVPLPNVNLVWRWTSLLEGGDPMLEDEFEDLLNRGPRERFC